jgi:hypothetical protein
LEGLKFTTPASRPIHGCKRCFKAEIACALRHDDVRLRAGNSIGTLPSGARRYQIHRISVGFGAKRGRGHAMVEALTEPDDLRRCIRDLAALSTLPAVWTNYGPGQISDSVAAVDARLAPAGGQPRRQKMDYSTRRRNENSKSPTPWAAER